MNYFKQTESLLCGNFWAPKSKEEEISRELEALLETNKNLISAHCTKIDGYTKGVPTYFNLNDFTSPFQTIVNTYGVPRYKEINPAFFTVVTFSYEFGVMFGDFGHGMALFLLALYMCKNADKFDKGYLKEIFFFRYML